MADNGIDLSSVTLTRPQKMFLVKSLTEEQVKEIMVFSGYGDDSIEVVNCRFKNFVKVYPIIQVCYTIIFPDPNDPDAMTQGDIFISMDHNNVLTMDY